MLEIFGFDTNDLKCGHLTDPLEFEVMNSEEATKELLKCAKVYKTKKLERDAVNDHFTSVRHRLKRLDKEIEDLRDYILSVSDAAKIVKVSDGEIKVRVKKGQEKLVITDEDQIPPEFYTTGEPVLCKGMVKEAILLGMNIEGAHIVKGQSLEVT